MTFSNIMSIMRCVHIFNITFIHSGYHAGIFANNFYSFSFDQPNTYEFIVLGLSFTNNFMNTRLFILKHVWKRWSEKFVRKKIIHKQKRNLL